MKMNCFRQFVVLALAMPERSRTLCLRVLPLVLGLMLPVSGHAQFNYTTDNGEITVTGYTGPGGDVIIPDQIRGLPVTSIGDFAFTDCDSLTAITVDALNSAYSSLSSSTGSKFNRDKASHPQTCGTTSTKSLAGVVYPTNEIRGLSNQVLFLGKKDFHQLGNSHFKNGNRGSILIFKAKNLFCAC